MASRLGSAGAAFYPSPERAAVAAAALLNRPLHSGFVQPPEEGAAVEAATLAAKLAAAARAGGRQSLFEDEAKQLLAVAGIVAPAGAKLTNRGDALMMASWLNYPVVAKLVAPGLNHKSDAGAVKLNLKDATEVTRALDELDALAQTLGCAPAYLIERFVPGPELIVGGKRDPQFGPAVMVGAGGTLAEMFGDVSLRLAPVDEKGAQEMLRELRCRPLLKGYRSARPADFENRVAAIVARVSELIALAPDIAEIDVNPVILSDEGALAADALVVLNG
ncbi:MAG: acetate--CoA ligase family protein [Chloroflexi bacterium]|nr:acetate--CoA ligase family protein [Chloroflexota bacterium]